MKTFEVEALPAGSFGLASPPGFHRLLVVGFILSLLSLVLHIGAEACRKRPME